MTDPTLNEGRGRTPVTDGVVNAMVRYGAARQCAECGFGVPKYPGRYPGTCPRCGDKLVITDQAAARGKKSVKESSEDVPVVITSRAARIQQIIESGRPSFAPYLDDSACSRAVTIPFRALEAHGGPDSFRAFFEGPTAEGLYFRIEEREDPVIVAEFDNTNARVRMFATTNPVRYLRVDPRADIVVEDHEGTFEAPAEPLAEGVLQDIADKAIGFLSQKLAKLWKMFALLNTVKVIWDEAQRNAGIKLPADATLRMAHGLRDEMHEVFVALGEIGPYVGEKREEESRLVESVTLLSVLGSALGLLGGIPMLLGALSKAAKWLGFSSIARALDRAYHVAHTIEHGVIEAAVPDKLSYAVYMAMWKRGWRVGAASQDGPMTFEEFAADRETVKAVSHGMYRLLLLFFFFVHGATHIMSAPLGAMFSGETAATGVKGVELSKSLQGALLGAKSAHATLESVNPENVCMVDLGESKDAARFSHDLAASLQVFLSENDAKTAAERLEVALVPAKCIIGEEALWILRHEATGYALGRGEAARLDEYFAEPARDRVRDHDHQRVAGAFAEDQRSSARRARRPGEGATQIRGGFRIHVGANQSRAPRKDVEQALQNKQNQKRGLRARIAGAKKWHRSATGQRLHTALARYNREARDGTDFRDKLYDIMDRVKNYTASAPPPALPSPRRTMGGLGVCEDVEPRLYGANQITARGPQDLDSPFPDDHLEAILRRLIVTQNMDVLQDVEFDDVTGSIYFFIDPVIMPDEVEEIVTAIRQERGTIQLVGSPNMSLPGEAVESDWWVLFLPGKGEGLTPDPRMYARNPAQYYTKVQAMVMAPPSPPEAVAQDIDVSSLMNAAGS